MAILRQLPATGVANGQATLTLVADAFDSRQRTTLVIYHDGRGETEASITTDSLKTTTIQSLVDAGCIVASTNSHGDSWGNQVALDDYVALYTYLVARWRPDDVVFLAQSMGGASGLLCYAADLVPRVRCFAGIYPVCNLAAAYNNGSQPGFKTDIRTAYGFSTDGQYASATSGHDPVLLPSSSWNGKRFRLWASDADTAVPKGQHADVLMANLSGAAEAATVVCTGGHGDPSHFQPSDLLAFLRRSGCHV